MSTTMTEPEFELESNFEPMAGKPKRSVRALVFVIALALVGGFALYTAASSNGKPAVTAISAQALADTYGAKVDLIGVAALGGMVQLRFTVLDTKKADALFHDKDKMPRLLIESNGQILEPPAGMKHSMKMVNGGSYFIIYGNRANMVKEGTKISVVVGDVKLEHQLARA
jgi:hypothetical protein